MMLIWSAETVLYVEGNTRTTEQRLRHAKWDVGGDGVTWLHGVWEPLHVYTPFVGTWESSGLSRESHGTASGRITSEADDVQT